MDADTAEVSPVTTRKHHRHEDLKGERYTKRSMFSKQDISFPSSQGVVACHRLFVAFPS
jgi:hypothetical protein